MAKPKRRRSQESARRSSSSGSQSATRAAASKKPAPGSSKPNPRFVELLAFAGYMLAVWLIMPTFYHFSDTPTAGLVWSSAALGVIVLFVTALSKNELGMRDRIKVFDSRAVGKPVAGVAWGIIGVVSLALVSNLPSF